MEGAKRDGGRKGGRKGTYRAGRVRMSSGRLRCCCM